MSILVENGAVDVFVEGNILFDIPFVFDMSKVSPQFLPVRIPLLESKVFPELLVEQLVNGRVAVDSSSWIAVPIPSDKISRYGPRCRSGARSIPDATAGSSFFINLARQTLLSEPVAS